ncbi:GNAT family N-acetyltransferase [Cellulomonas sp. B6]|uniref:GNAT family N-acetyltransferase n=1 Tax=Cellulomonas sp. B6 TaxID=1295626 RepID=UPI00073AE998|nr:GNAT family N-acetyltransferase [Cellulomonas sp. B6]KSW20570.1 GCN5 family acetyltransferase [Cellulomonas sp. B6]
MPTTIETRTPAQLTPAELYALLRLRVDVFVVEQACPYPELDGRDLEPGTRHLWAHEGGELLGTVRVLDVDGDRPVVGRVATAPAARGRGVAGALIERALGLCRAGAPVELHGQAHLERWYERFGFVRTGDTYDEDGIPHVPMVRTPPAR